MVTVSHLICPLVNSFLILDTSLWWSFLSLTCSPRTSNCFDFSRSLSFNWPWEMRRFSRMLLKSKDWHQLPLSMCVQQELFFSGKSKLLIFLAGCKDLGPVLNAIFVSPPPLFDLTTSHSNSKLWTVWLTRIFKFFEYYPAVVAWR